MKNKKSIYILIRLTIFFSILDLISRAKVKNASSTFIDAFAEVSKNLIPYSIANCSPLSLETWNPIQEIKINYEWKEKKV